MLPKQQIQSCSVQFIRGMATADLVLYHQLLMMANVMTYRRYVFFSDSATPGFYLYGTNHQKVLSQHVQKTAGCCCVTSEHLCSILMMMQRELGIIHLEIPELPNEISLCYA